MFPACEVKMMLPGAEVNASKAWGGTTKPVLPATSSVAFVYLSGEIDMPLAQDVSAEIDAAAANPRVREIALIVDCPGGQSHASGIISQAVAHAVEIKPVHVYAIGLLTSGAYYAAAPATSITANEGAMIGSIGTYLVLTDSSEAAKRQGFNVMVATTAPVKHTGLAGTEITADQFAYVQHRVDAINRIFLAAVAKGRNIPMKTVIQDIGTGYIWLGREALANRLVDKVQTIYQFLDELDARQPNEVAEMFANLTGSAAVAKLVQLTGAKGYQLRNLPPAAMNHWRTKHPTLVAEAIKEVERQQQALTRKRRQVTY